MSAAASAHKEREKRIMDMDKVFNPQAIEADLYKEW